MNHETRTLIRVNLKDAAQAAADLGMEPPHGKTELDDLVERLMGKNAEARFDFIQKNATFVENIDI